MKYLLLKLVTDIDLYSGDGGGTEPKIIGQYDQLITAYDKAIKSAENDINKIQSELSDFECIDDINFLTMAAFESLLNPNKFVSVCYFNGMYNNGKSNIEYHYYIAEMEE